jgi:hypothetical protein
MLAAMLSGSSMDSTCSRHVAAAAPLVAPQFALSGPTCCAQHHSAAGAPSAGAQQAAAQDPATAAQGPATAAHDTTACSLLPLSVWTTCQSEHGLVAVLNPVPDEQLVRAGGHPLVPSLDTAVVDRQHVFTKCSRAGAPGVPVATDWPCLGGGNVAMGKDGPFHVAGGGSAGTGEQHHQAQSGATADINRAAGSQAAQQQANSCILEPVAISSRDCLLAHSRAPRPCAMVARPPDVQGTLVAHDQDVEGAERSVQATLSIAERVHPHRSKRQNTAGPEQMREATGGSCASLHCSRGSPGTSIGMAQQAGLSAHSGGDSGEALVSAWLLSAAASPRVSPAHDAVDGASHGGSLHEGLVEQEALGTLHSSEEGGAAADGPEDVCCLGAMVGEHSGRDGLLAQTTTGSNDTDLSHVLSQ